MFYIFLEEYTVMAFAEKPSYIALKSVTSKEGAIIKLFHTEKVILESKSANIWTCWQNWHKILATWEE